MSKKTIFKLTKNTIPFGFESTWRYKSDKTQIASDATGLININMGSLIYNKNFYQEFNKIYEFKPIEQDPYNIEIPTKIIKNKANLLKAFNKLSKLLSEHGFIESSKSANSHLEGGGHLHLDYSEVFGYLNSQRVIRNEYGDDQNLFYETFALFFENINNYIVNNPWIPWAFNAPNDNECAINNILNTRIDKDIKIIKKYGFTKTNLLICDFKRWAITLRHGLGTLEFRFFGMPKNSFELDLHIKVADAIYRYCFDMAINGKRINRIYNSWRDIANVKYETSLNGLKLFCKQMDIEYKDLETTGKINNLTLRYEYQNYVVGNKKYLIRDRMYLN